MTSFQSTPSQRGRLKSRNTARNTRAFQSTPSQRGRPLSWQKIFASKLFQSTPSQRGRQCEVKLVLTHQPFQSTPSQRGRPFQGWKPCRGEPISIHALAKRATCSAGAAPVRWSHFNPRPRKEGDCPIISFSTVPNLFQSTPSQRGRPVRQVKNIVYRRISIHALAKRATTPRRNMLTERKNFNPRPRKEGDDDSSRHIQGCDISIHALAKRATSFSSCTSLVAIHFNPRPRKEGDGASTRTCGCRGHFNPRPRKEGDVLKLNADYMQELFQSTPSQRGRPMTVNSVLAQANISIHALAKRATLRGHHLPYLRS